MRGRYAPRSHWIVLLATPENELSTPAELYAVATKKYVPGERLVMT